MTMRSLRAALLALPLLVALVGCESRESSRSEPRSGGDPKRGQALIAHFGCGSCHQIPGIARADGRVGPELHDVRTRTYIGGVVPNSPENLIRWIRNPRELDPRTAMPAVGADEAQARDIAAYLYSR